MVFFDFLINAIEFINVLAAEQDKLKKTNNQLIDEEGRMNKIKHHPTCQISQIKAVVSQIELRPLYFKLNRQGDHSLRLANWCIEAILYNTKEEESLPKSLTARQIIQKALSLEKHLKAILEKGGLTCALTRDNLKDDCRSLRNILKEVDHD